MPRLKRMQPRCSEPHRLAEHVQKMKPDLRHSQTHADDRGAIAIHAAPFGMLLVEAAVEEV